MSGEGEKSSEKDEKERYIEELSRDIDRSNDQYDKNALYLGAGALGLSITFIDRMIGDLPEATGKGWLLTAWILLIVSILSGFVSHFASMEGKLRLLGRLKTPEEKRDKDPQSTLKYWDRWVSFLNILTGTTLIIGISVLVLFVYFNVTNEA